MKTYQEIWKLLSSISKALNKQRKWSNIHSVKYVDCLLLWGWNRDVWILSSMKTVSVRTEQSGYIDNLCAFLDWLYLVPNFQTGDDSLELRTKRITLVDICNSTQCKIKSKRFRETPQKDLWAVYSRCFYLCWYPWSTAKDDSSSYFTYRSNNESRC